MAEDPSDQVKTREAQSIRRDPQAVSERPAAARPPKSLLRAAGRAIADFRMINAGDRILLGVSGGKDSLSLLQVLLHLQRHAPVRFDLGVITVDPMVEGFDPSPLRAYYGGLGLEYFYERQPIVEAAQAGLKGDSLANR